jgi:hypothetical protein
MGWSQVLLAESASMLVQLVVEAHEAVVQILPRGAPSGVQ